MINANLKHVAKQMIGNKGYEFLIKHYYSVIRYHLLRKILYFGVSKYCPLCNNHIRTFVAHKNDPFKIYDSLCPICGCKSTHRRNWLTMSELIRVNNAPIKLLHVAPEPGIALLLSREKKVDYVSGDIRPGVGQLTFDICDIPFEEDTFDFIYCCHVLMMLKNDQPAMGELFRVLKKGGLALIENPVAENQMTIEPATASERMRQFNDENIMRLYGNDYRKRLESSGFTVTNININSTSKDFNRMELYIGTTIVCIKPL